MSSPRRAAWWPAALLVPLCAALYLPGLVSLPPIDRDEARYAQATRQMLVSGDFAVPRLQDAPRLIKPIGIYWLQAAAVRLTGGWGLPAIVAHRLPSVLGALAAVLGTYWIGRRWFAVAPRCLGAAWLAGSALLVVEAHLATTDAALLACVVAAQVCLASLYDAARRGRTGSAVAAAGFWIAQAAGILIKGPVAPLVGALTIATLAVADRGARPGGLVRALRWWWGVPLAAACVAPWAVAVAMRTGWDALPRAVAGDILPRLAGGIESHGAPPGIYTLIAPATFWPGSLALAFALPTAWRRRRRTAERFLLAWLVPLWLLFECIPTKLPNYVLPAFPALALLCARAALAAPARRRPRPTQPAIRLLAIGWAVLTVAIGFTPAAVAWRLAEPRVTVLAVPSALGGLLVATVCLRRFWAGRLAAAAWFAAIAAPLVYATMLEDVLPRFDALWPSRAAAAAIEGLGADRRLAAVGYGEPSLVFLTRSDVALLDPEAAAQFLARHPDGLVLVAGEQHAGFVAAAARHGLALRNRWATAAYSYTKGEGVDLQLYDRAP